MTDAGVTANSPSRSALLPLAGLVTLVGFVRTASTPALTLIADGLGVEMEVLQTTMAVVLISSAIVGPIIGTVADSMGRRQLLFPALGLYIVGGIAAAAAPTISWLMAARVLQAVGSGTGLILSRAIARDLHSGPELMRLWAGVTLAASLAPIISPIVGGALADWFGWRAIFIFSALGGCAVFAGMLLLPETRKGPASPIKVKAILATYRTILTARSFVIPNIVGGALIAALFAYSVSAASIYVKELQLSPALVGFFPTATAGGLMLGTSLARWSATRVQPMMILRVGSLIALASSIAMACVPVSAPYLLAAITLYAVGYGFALPVTSSMAMSDFAEKAGAASALLGAVQSIGAAVGTFGVTLIGGTADRAMPIAMIISCIVAVTFSFLSSAAATTAAKS